MLAPAQISTRNRGKMTGTSRKDRLYLQVGELRDFSSAIIALGERAPERMTLSQASFFLLAAMADILGSPATFSELKEAAGPQLNRALHTTYKVLLTEGRMRDGVREPGVGWLTAETNPADNRQRFLRLTAEGREVIHSVLDAVNEGREATIGVQ